MWHFFAFIYAKEFLIFFAPIDFIAAGIGISIAHWMKISRPLDVGLYLISLSFLRFSVGWLIFLWWPVHFLVLLLITPLILWRMKKLNDRRILILLASISVMGKGLTQIDYYVGINVWGVWGTEKLMRDTFSIELPPVEFSLLQNLHYSFIAIYAIATLSFIFWPRSSKCA